MITLRWKLTWQIAALIVSLILISSAGLWGLYGLKQNYDAALDGYARLRKLYEVGLHVQAARMLISLPHPETARARSELQLARSVFDADFPAGESSSQDRDQQAVGDALDAATRPGDSPDDLNAAAGTQVINALSAMEKQNRDEIESAQVQAQRKRQLTLYWMAGLCTAVALLALAIGIVQYRSVMSPLRSLKAAAQSAAKGSFTSRVPETGSVEFADLARSFNSMATELDNLYRDLQQKVDAKSKELLRNERLASVGFLAAGVAHEINNPLGIITAHAELSMQTLDAGKPASLDQVRQALGVITEEAFRCKQIVEKLLSLAKAPSEAMETFSLSELARDVVATMAALPEYKDRTLLVSAAGVHDKVTGREGEIKQVMLNLLFNAMEATPAGGEVKVSIAGSGANVELSVSDNGRGMTAQMLDRVFEPFYTDPRGKAAAPGAEPRGTGLGLSITHAIIQRHNGNIRAQSAGEGKGSRFIVTLPLAENEARA